MKLWNRFLTIFNTPIPFSFPSLVGGGVMTPVEKITARAVQPVRFGAVNIVYVCVCECVCVLLPYKPSVFWYW